MGKTKKENEKLAVVLNFSSPKSLKFWLRMKNEEAGSPEAFNLWLEEWYENGNCAKVRGEVYTYHSCLELV